MQRLAPLALALAVALAGGCGAGETKGTAAVWVTSDRGAKLLLVQKVPAGLTAMQALDRVADVKTRYGGRFVTAINGIEGSLSAQRDWFYFVNGYEADRSAAEYVLHDGDVEWWDFRSWKDSPEVKVVVGAFPEPFLHGYDGKTRTGYVFSADVRAGRALARRLHARYGGSSGTVPPSANTLVIRKGLGSFAARATSAGAPVTFVFRGDWHDLVNGRFRYRYEVRP